jgi:DNA-directed RNA polymerase sigma subunit (sigma70/sigma32)
MEIKLGDSLPRTLENIGDKYGVCRMRICQIEKKAREKIMDLHSLASRDGEALSRVT